MDIRLFSQFVAITNGDLDSEYLHTFLLVTACLGLG